MAVTLNSTGNANGAVLSSDNSGNLALQTGGINALTIDSSQNVSVSKFANLGAVANVKITGGSTGQVLSTDGNGVLSWSTVGSSSSVSNGTSNVSIATSGGNVTTSVAGNANIVVVTGTGANITGTLNATGNANVGNLGTGGAITATGNVDGGNLNTGGALIVTGNANVGNLGTGGIITAIGNANVGNLGTIGLITATGNVSGGNLTTGGAVVATGNVSGGNLTTGGVITATGNVSGGNLTTGGAVVATGNVSGGNLTTGGALSVTGNANVGNLGTGGLIVATGNVDGGNLNTGGALSVTGNANVGNLGTGGIITATGNVSGGNLTTGGVLSVTGNANVGNLGSGGVITATGNVSGGNLTTSGILSVSGNSESSISGNLNMNSNHIVSVANPTNPQDVATKSYVDAAVTSLHVHDSCYVATTNDLATATSGTITYNNGNSGVGANIETTGAFTSIDGANVQTVGTRILVKNEANAVLNGIYTYANTTTIVRATDFDTTAEAAGGDFFFVTSGNTNADTGWVQTQDNVVMGTSNIAFTQFSGAGTYSAGVGLNLQGTQFNIANTGVNAASYGSGDSVASFTVNSQGQLTAASNTVITANAANLSGTSLNSNIVSSNLTSVGTLSSLTVTGNANVGNLATTGIITANGPITAGAVTYANTDGNANQVLSTYGNGITYWANVSSGGSSNIANGNSSVSISTAAGNIDFSVNGAANVFQVGAGGNLVGNLIRVYSNGQTTLGLNSASADAAGVAVGRDAKAAAGAVSIGEYASYGGASNITNSVTIGYRAGYLSGGSGAINEAVFIGRQAGYWSPEGSNNAILIGALAGSATGVIPGSQAGNAYIGIGNRAFIAYANNDAIGIGSNVGYQAGKPNGSTMTAGANIILIGANAGYRTSGNASISIGKDSGAYIGENSIAIGANAGTNALANNSIVLNATGANLTSSTANTFVVKPVRNANTANVLYYNNTTGEITYDVSAGGGGGGSNIANGNSNVSISTSAGNIDFSVNGTANVFQVAAGGNLVGSLIKVYSNSRIGIGPNQTQTFDNGIAIGGTAKSGDSAVGIGVFANAVANQSIAIGSLAGVQAAANGVGTISIGPYAGSRGNANAIYIGYNAGYWAQGGQNSIYVGQGTAGSFASVTGNNVVVIGSGATPQGPADDSVIIGTAAGTLSGRNVAQQLVTGANAIAIGHSAGGSANGNYNIAIGYNSGYQANSNSIAIGANTAANSRANVIAIGLNAGASTMGVSAIAIGANAGVGNAQANNTIILNATGANLEATTANTWVVKPVRAVTDVTGLKVVYYNPTTGELVYYNV